MNYHVLFSLKNNEKKQQLLQLCTALSVFNIGHCTVIHFDAGGVSLVDQ